jgi:2-hydroxychromene-2-carboxylate isomerase
MKASNNTPPAQVPAKGLYMTQHDLPRLSRLAGLQLSTPKVFPALTLKAQRALTALAMRQGDPHQAALIVASR